MRPDWSPKGDWIAFQASPSAVRAIWLCRPDGSDLRQVSTDAFLPFWNGDGTRVYYVGENSPFGGLAIKYYDLGTNETVTVHEAAEQPGWQYNSAVPSRDNVWLAASRFIEGPSDPVLLGTLAGGPLELLWPRGEIGNGVVVDWSRDNNYLLVAYETSHGPSMGLWTYELSNGEIRQLTLEPPGANMAQTINDGSWGPNGEVAFSLHYDSKHRWGWVYLIPAPR
jgi:Tol biopolymer transport system component